MERKKDDIFNSPLGKIIDFKFDEKVANVFEDMIQRSIPGYATIINMIGMFAGHYSKPNTNVYDLGCSLGAASFAMSNKISFDTTRIIAVDNSKDMINRAKSIAGDSREKIEFICADLQDVKIKNASIVVLNFTLQFIDLKLRQQIINNIYKGLNEGGILILSEKIKFEQEELNIRQTERYYNFKRLNGYSELEISQKRDALENVLIPETLSSHYDRLKNAGFKYIDQWYQCFNFISIIAEK